ncbi:hypothetical protein [Reticulibacter mediterranei]|uniref:hypothetical protein n=1 Tax=Reticulibacter mediterranei TaxID=2778369 RepID=UPI001C68FA2E|nr:hypothetical protein [Reticulibacter mediterranei]
MFLQDDRENVYDQPSIPYQPAYQETAFRANQEQEAATSSVERGARMPKERARALVNAWKRWIVVASLASMGAFAGLVATHLPASATTEQQPTSTTTTSNNNTQTTTSGERHHHRHNDDDVSSSSDSSSGSFFQQQGGDQFGSSSSGQQPVTRSHSS